MEASSFAEFVSVSRQRIEAVLDHCLAEPKTPDSNLLSAMRYSALNGGKRVRPLLCYAAAHAIAEIDQNTDKIAAAVELCHAYSLIHDDLPAMDDDDLRRGKPTCHIAFDEATAILAGDALQALAFQQLAKVSATRRDTIARLLSSFATAAGMPGMVGGQAFDIGSVNRQLTEAQLESMHRRKTGALINASILMGALATERADDAQLTALTAFGSALGLAFQVQDDILDVESDTQTLGKRQGSDDKHHKPTYISVLGLESARAKAAQLHRQAIDALAKFDHRADYLRQIADYIVKRDR